MAYFQRDEKKVRGQCHLESQAPAPPKLFTVSFETSKRLATEIGTFGKSRIPLKRPQPVSRCYTKRETVAFGWRKCTSHTNLVSPKSWGSLVAEPLVACGRITITILVDIASCRCPFLPAIIFPTTPLFTVLVVSLSSIA